MRNATALTVEQEFQPLFPLLGTIYTIYIDALRIETKGLRAVLPLLQVNLYIATISILDGPVGRLQSSFVRNGINLKQKQRRIFVYFKWQINASIDANKFSNHNASLNVLLVNDSKVHIIIHGIEILGGNIKYQLFRNI